MNTKEELLALLRVCNAPPAAIDVAEAAYELGFRMGQLQPLEEKTELPVEIKENS
jgi:hypothetical protein